MWGLVRGNKIMGTLSLEGINPGLSGWVNSVESSYDQRARLALPTLWFPVSSCDISCSFSCHCEVIFHNTLTRGQTGPPNLGLSSSSQINFLHSEIQIKTWLNSVKCWMTDQEPTKACFKQKCVPMASQRRHIELQDHINDCFVLCYVIISENLGENLILASLWET
jgi:hypothetical protein